MAENNDWVIKVRDEDFKEKVLEQSKKVPVVVDFTATWCMPCREIGPVLERLAGDYGGRFILAKASTEANKKACYDYSVSAIPSVKFFRDGKVVDEFVGAVPEAEIKGWLDKNLQ